MSEPGRGTVSMLPAAVADRIALAICLAVALGLRLWSLGAHDLWSDEVHTLHATRLPLGELVAERLRAGHLPLYFVLEKSWTAVFGESQFALRLPSALLGTALVLPAFALFRRLLPAAQARWALAVLAVHPTFLELSREARMYSLLGLAFVVLAEGAVAALDEGRLPRRFWVAAAAGPFVHATWGLAVAPLALWTAFEATRLHLRRGRTHAARDAVVGMAGSAALLVGLLLAATPQTQTLDRRPWPAESFVFVARLMTGSRISSWDRWFAGAALVAWACCLAVALHRCRGRALRFALWSVLGTSAAVLLAGSIGGFPFGPVRYHHLAGIGLCVAVSTSLGWASEQVRSVQTELERSRPLPQFVAARPVVGYAIDYARAVSIAAGPLCLASPVALAWVLAGGEAFRAGTPDTRWSDLAPSVALRVPLGDTVYVPDPGSRVVGEHYWKRPLTVGSPLPGSAGWRVTISTGRRFRRIDVDRLHPQTDVAPPETPSKPPVTPR